MSFPPFQPRPVPPLSSFGTGPRIVITGILGPEEEDDEDDFDFLDDDEEDDEDLDDDLSDDDEDEELEEILEGLDDE